MGSSAARLMSERGQYRIIVASRGLAKAQETAAAIGCEARRIDATEASTWDAAITGVDLVLACTDQGNLSFAAYVLSTGRHYVDVTAADPFFQAVEILPPQSVRATAVLSVGLAPGVTNLLACEAASHLDEVTSIDVGILLGLGDDHGRAAIAWTVREIFAPRAAEPRVINFGPPWFARRTYWMAFADQYALGRTMEHVRVTTRLAFDSRLITAAIFALGARFEGRRSLARLASSLAPMVSFGSDACVAVSYARGRKNGKPALAGARFSGRTEAQITAHVAAIVVDSVLRQERGCGVFHIHQLFEPAVLLAEVANATGGEVATW